jgi:tRNA pseudouridine55 synthase
MLIDKPVGWTSHDVVAAVRRQLGTRSVGHAGTLDPFATGLLVVLIGRATRLARFVEAGEKCYQATVRFGVATDTDDSTGTPVASVEPTTWPTHAELLAAAASLEGAQRQRPPAFSAKHVGGTRAYVLARAGEAVDLAPVEVMVHRLELGEWTPPTLTLTATVGRGTYIRAIARDLGALVGLPAHCATLRRTTIGPFAVADAVVPEAISPAALLPPAAMVAMLPQVRLDADEARDVGFGRTVPQHEPREGHAALLAEDGRLLAVATAAEGRWQPEVVLEPAA